MCLAQPSPARHFLITIHLVILGSISHEWQETTQLLLVLLSEVVLLEPIMLVKNSDSYGKHASKVPNNASTRCINEGLKGMLKSGLCTVLALWKCWLFRTAVQVLVSYSFEDQLLDRLVGLLIGCRLHKLLDAIGQRMLSRVCNACRVSQMNTKWNYRASCFYRQDTTDNAKEDKIYILRGSDPLSVVVGQQAQETTCWGLPEEK